MPHGPRTPQHERRRSLRTPDERFADLPGFPFAPHYVEELPGYARCGCTTSTSRRCGTASGRTVLCLHGQPTWCYLYRKMIPVFTAAGHRVVAPDFLGFGRSDKPVDDDVYTFNFHRGMLVRFMEALDLRARDARGAGLGRAARPDAADGVPATASTDSSS